MGSAALTAMVERISACHGGDTYFTAAEVATWPADFTRALESLGLLAKASPAISAECTGCEEACVMPVEVIPGPNAALTRALIFCDKRDDISRVDVPLHSLERRKSSGAMLAEALAKLLLMSPVRPTQIDATRWQVGSFNGLKQKSPLLLTFDLEPMLVIAGHTAKLVEFLAFKKGAVAIDLAALRRLVDNPTGQATLGTEPLDDRAKRVFDRINELKGIGIKNYVVQVAAEEGLSEATIKNDYKKHADGKKQRKPGASVFDLAKPAVSLRNRKRQQ